MERKIWLAHYDRYDLWHIDEALELARRFQTLSGVKVDIRKVRSSFLIFFTVEDSDTFKRFKDDWGWALRYYTLTGYSYVLRKVDLRRLEKYEHYRNVLDSLEFVISLPLLFPVNGTYFVPTSSIAYNTKFKNLLGSLYDESYIYFGIAIRRSLAIFRTAPVGIVKDLEYSELRDAVLASAYKLIQV